MALYPPEYLYKVEYTTQGATDLTVPFEYLLKDHVFVTRLPTGETVPQLQTVNVDWTWLDNETIRLVVPIAAGELVTIQRQTRIDARMVDYADGARLGADGLNINTKQLLYLLQEITEARVEVPGQYGPGGNNPLTQDEMDALVADLQNTQLLQDLLALIPLVDINAEVIIANQLKNHRDWLIAGDFDFRITGQGTRISQVEYELNDPLGAFASYQTLVGARFDNNEASIGTLQTAQATTDGAIATMTTDIQARVPYADLENQISLSSYINGVKASADSNSADISTIESALVGVGGDFENPLGSSILGIFQTTLDGHSGQISANDIDIANLSIEVDPNGVGVVGQLMTWRQNLSSFFNADPTNGTTLASAIQTKWQTYTDVQSAVATRVTTLEANTQPLFFRTAAPHTYDVEFSGTDWNTYGFPEGSMWYYIQPDNSMEPYIWKLSSTDPERIDAGVGWWIPATDGALGAKIQTVEDVVVGPYGSAASLSTHLQSVWGGNINSIQELLEAYVDPDTGLMYDTWNVRINQTLGGSTPVIAGVGLGMQADLNNPDRNVRSDFIVMADYFSVVAPPASGTVLNGTLDPADVLVPFIIDTASGNVIINGDLFVRGTLRAYEGAMDDLHVGRVQAGYMSALDDELAQSTSVRVGMYSSRNGYWNSSTASPFAPYTNPQKFLLWAGTGVMNHNNATFYVDSEGNGYFAGQVVADNINGDVSTAEAVSISVTTVTATSDTTWTTIGSWTSSAGSVRSKVPTAIVNVNMFGPSCNAGSCRLLLLPETAAGSNSYPAIPTADSTSYEVARASSSQGYGNTQSLIGSSAPLTGRKVKVVIQHRGNAGVPGTRPQSNGCTGLFMFIS